MTESVILPTALFVRGSTLRGLDNVFWRDYNICNPFRKEVVRREKQSLEVTSSITALVRRYNSRVK